MSEITSAEVTPKKHRTLVAPWVKGQSGNPAGRPKGARSKLSENFLADLHDAWEAHGPAALTKCAEQRPDAFCRIVADLLPKDIRIDATIGVTTASFAENFRNALALLGNEPPRQMRVIHHRKSDARQPARR